MHCKNCYTNKLKLELNCVCAAARGSKWMEREERSRQFHERQLEERRKRLDEQRDKEDRRRAAVEEKRRQKLEEEKARYEAVIRRTMERSQRVMPKSNRWSWGGTLSASTSHNSDTDRRSVSTMNLSKPTDPVISKRLSSSSATLLNSQDRGMRSMPLTPWENTMISRLQTPTHSYLARSRSAMSLGSTKPHQKTPNPKKSRSPPPPTSIPLSPSNPSLLPGNLRPNRVTSESPRVTPEGEGAKKEDVEPPKIEPEAPTTKSEPSPESLGSSPTTRPSAGTTDPEEASRLLAEKRRQAREQREREEEEKRQQEEAERLCACVHSGAAGRRWPAGRQRSERRERRRHSGRLKRRRDKRRRQKEEEARQREKGERLRLEREKHFQKEEAERMERKKRLEEIMKRTRRSDQKTTPQRNGDVSLQSGQNSGDFYIYIVTAQLRENGAVTEALEEVIEVPMGTKLSCQDGDGEVEENEEEEKRKVPLLAFRENGSMHNVSGLEENPAQ
uniref:Ensconsin-like n=1 Tax=Sinocyclocheilus rhinocerous TaxID=307959 RepID=A0A673JBH1_9TELE